MYVVFRDVESGAELFTDWENSAGRIELDKFVYDLRPQFGEMLFVSCFYRIEEVVTNFDRRELIYYLRCMPGYTPVKGSEK